MTVFLAATGILVSVAAGMIIVRTVQTGTPPMPSGKLMREQMLIACERAVASGEVTRIVELGCGWGGLTRELSSRFPDVPVIGIEISLVPYLVARLRSPKRRRGPRVTRGDISHFVPHSGNLIVAYLSRPHMEQLATTIEKAGGPQPLWVVSSTFALPDAQPLETRRVADLYGSPVYLYAVRRGFTV